MKKILFVFALTLTTYFANAQNELIATFLTSDNFASLKDFVAKYGEVNVEESTVRYFEDDASKPILNIVLKKDNRLAAIIEVVPISDKNQNILPNNSHYAMQLVDYSKYEVETKNGVIKTIDLNYDQYISSNIEVSNAEINSFVTFPMPDEIKKKYVDLTMRNEIEVDQNKKYHFCDKNQNGNVSFGECMGCMQGACNGSPSCATMCWLTNVGGIGTSVGGQCSISMGAACIIISIRW